MKKCMWLVLPALLALIAGCNHDNDSCANGHCPAPHPYPAPVIQEETPQPTPTPVVPSIPDAVHGSVAATATVHVDDPGSDQPDDLNFSDDKGHIAYKAVIVGINTYPDAPLEGCVDDATDIMHLATNGLDVTLEPIAGFNDSGTVQKLASLGYKRSNVKFLMDNNATTANIRAALVWMTKGTQAGDHRMFWYSGHGAEDAISPDANSEPDHLNQLMCPVDFDWSREHMLIDKDLVSIFAQMPNGVIFNWGSDSCHSGDLDKKLTKLKRRNAPKQFPNMPAATAARIAKVKARMDKNTLMHRGMLNGLLDVGFLSGCKSDQTSADSSDSNGRPCGAMTHYFLQVYARIPSAPLVTIAEKERAALVQDQYDQLPQAEGARAASPWQK